MSASLSWPSARALAIAGRAVMRHRMQPRHDVRRLQNLPQDRGEMLGPLRLTLGTENEILANLDEGMGKPSRRRVLIQGVALELAGIGLVVANDDIGNGIQS